jgi:hypothetical protein
MVKTLLVLVVLAVAHAFTFELKDSPLPRTPEATRVRAVLSIADVDFPLPLGEYNRSMAIDVYRSYRQAVRTEVKNGKGLVVRHSSLDEEVPVLMWLDYMKPNYTLAIPAGVIVGVAVLFWLCICCAAFSHPFTV